MKKLDILIFSWLILVMVYAIMRNIIPLFQITFVVLMAYALILYSIKVCKEVDINDR